MTNNLLSKKGSWFDLAIFVGLLSVMSFSMRLHAQVVGATLSGSITDASGAVITNAQVSIRNAATGAVRAVSTNADGLYTAPNLLPGAYVVTASAGGFSSVTTNVTLTVGSTQVLNLSLQVGSVTQSVEVTGVAPTVNLTDPSLGGLNDETTIRELPLNGRSWTDLATLQAGVAAIHTQPALGGGRTTRGFGDQLTISGARPQQNNYRLNGVSINSYDNGAPGSVLGGNMGVDAISEFSVLTTNYSTEYGRASGGVINAITKSGTNDFHGDVYEFLRNSALDARNYFDGAKIPEFRRNQFGASAGGPIRKNKTFIFGDYEGLRQNLGRSQFDTVPSAAARAGNLTSGTVTVDPQVTRYLNAFWPLPNGPVSGDKGIYEFGNPQITTENYFTLRVDHKLSEKDTLSGTYFYDFANVAGADEFKNKIDNLSIHRQFATLEENHVFSKAVNDLRFGFNREAFVTSNTGVTSAASDPSFGFTPGNNAGSIFFGGGVNGGLTSFSGGVNLPGAYRWNTFQVYDDVSLVSGIHSIKLGGGVERDQLNGQSCGYHNGLFTFNSLHDFLINRPQNVEQDLVNPTCNDRGGRLSIFGLYIQDDIRLRRNFTVNVGMRWEMATSPSEVHGELANLINLTDPAVRVGGLFLKNNSTRDFEPRVGFAWDPFGTGKTSIRAGFGLYDQLLLLGYTNQAYHFTYPWDNGGVVAAPILQPGDFPTLGPERIVNGLASLKRVEHYDTNPGRALVMQWNFSIQREITPNLTGLISYVGSHAVHGVTNEDDLDIVLPIVSPVGYLWPCEAPGLPFVPAGTTPPPGLSPGCNGIGSGTRFNTNFGRLSEAARENSSVYHGLQVQLTRRMSHGFQVQGSFAWSRDIDMASGAEVGDAYDNGISSLPYFINSKLTRAPSDWNTPRVLSINYVWDIPTAKSLAGLAETGLAGWELGGIFSASDGVPFTPQLVGDPLGENSSDPYDFPDRLRGPGCGSLVNPGNVNNYIKLQCFAVPAAVVYQGIPYLRMGGVGNGGRNVAYGPGLQTLDLLVIKNTHVPRISETFNVQFRAEAFNVLNRSNFRPPIDNEFIFDPSIPGFGIAPANPASAIVSGAGAIDQTTTTSRQMQFALKVIW